jgi:hypothetical protein
MRSLARIKDKRRKRAKKVKTYLKGMSELSLVPMSPASQI